MHLSFTFELGDAFGKCFAIEADGPAQGLIVIKDGTETKWQHGGALEAFTYHMRVLQQGFLSEFAGRDILAYDYGKIAAGIAKSLGIAYAFQAFNGKWTTGACAALECLLLSNAVCVPCHRMPLLLENIKGRLLSCERAKVLRRK